MSSPAIFVRFKAALLMIVFFRAATWTWAHQPFESTTEARLETGSLVLSVVMSAEMATALTGEIGPIEETRALDRGNFEQYRPHFERRAARFYEVVAGDRELALDRTMVRMNDEGELAMTLRYPATAQWPLRMRATFLSQMPPGYGNVLSVFNAQDQLLGRWLQTHATAEAVVAAPMLTSDEEPVFPQGTAPNRLAIDSARSTQPEARVISSGPGVIPVAAAVCGAILLLVILIVWRRAAARRATVALLVLGLAAVTAQAQRQMEKLGRGVIAVRSSSTQVYVGWRLLGNDPDDIAFNLYRAANGGGPVKINAAPLTATTDYVDTPANLSTTSYAYSVRPVLGGVEVADTWAHPLSAPFTLPANATVRQYLPVPLQATPDGGAHKVKFCWVGDLDGDGEYDFVVDRLNPDAATRQFLEAYKRDGTLLWRMDMGPNSVNQYNIEPGSSAISIGHGDNVTVYDLDGDGLAEVIVRTANGVVFGNGATLVEADDRKQFLSIVNGLTGAEMARALVPNPILTDGPMNGHMGILYLDGQRPSVLLAAKNRADDQSFHGAITAWDWRGGVLTQRWSWLDLGAQHSPEGHQIRVADVDNDGRDEFIDIGYVLDDNGTQLFNLPEVAHGDRFHLADIDPDRPGLETFIIQQDNGSGLATALFDAGTGAYVKKWYASGVVDVGRGVAGDFDAAYKGLEMFSTQPGTFDAKGNQIHATQPFPPEAIWWDADLGREFVATVGSSAEAPAIEEFNPANPGSKSRLYTIYNETPPGVYQAYGGRPAFWGDLFGDWREELLCVANDNSELRIYTTKNAATNRLYTLMHNPQYRCQATTKGYVQASYVDYYLGYGMTPPQPPPMVDAKLTWRGGAGATTWDAGVTPSWRRGGANSTFANGDTVRFDIGGDNSTTVALAGALQPGAVTVWSPKSYMFDGTSGALGGSMKLVKAGAGTLTISGNHSFTGKTTVWDGALLVNGDLQGSAVTVWGGTWGGTWGGALSAGTKGGRIGGSGRFSQAVALKYRGAITPGAGMGSAGTLTLGAGLTAEDGAVLALDLSDDPTGTVKANDRIAVTGNLALSGKVAIVLKALNTQLAPGSYTLLTYTGALTGGVANLTVTAPPGTPYTLAAGSGAITLNVPATRAPAAVTWRGSGAAWDLAASQNWLRSGAPDIFVAGDTVTFDATGAAAPTATLSTALPTAGVTVNAATDYTFAGAGSLSGAGGLTKTGAGTLTISTTNDYTGPTTISGGVLAVAALNDGGYPSSLGAASTAAGNFVINGGTLRLTGSQTNTNRSLTLGGGGGTFDIATAGSAMQVSGAIVGTGALTKTGPGTLLLASTNTYTGGTIINGGTIYLAGSNANENALGSGAVTMNNGRLKMADVQNNDVAAWNLVVPTGATARLDADGRCGLTGTLTGGGAFTFWTGYVRTDLRGNWSAFTGQILAITDDDGGDFRVTNTAGYANAALNLGDEVHAYYNSTPPSGGQTIDIGELSGTATSSLAGGPTSGRTVTWRIGARNTSATFAGVIDDGTGLTAITKIGAGALTLTGACTYTGATTVQAGALLVNGSLSGSNVTVQSGAALGGSGAIAGNVSVQAGGRLAFVASGGAIIGLNITGNLTLNGTITITPAAGSGGFAQGTYTIATYSGALAGTYNLVWQPPAGSVQTATFDTSTPGIIKIIVARDAAMLTWTGAAGSAWDTTTTNWTLNGANEVFTPPDSALFDDTAISTAVALAGPLAPGAVTFANSAQNYAVSATGGGISGSGGVTKNGTGKVTLYSANGHTGATTINAGILALGDDGSTTAGLYQQGGATGAGAASTSPGSGAIDVRTSGQLRLGGRGGATVYTFILSNPITLDGGTLVSYDGQQKLTGGIAVGANGATIVTAWNQKNLWLNGPLTGSGNLSLDDLIASGDTSRARFRIDTANNPYNGTLTINGPSAGYHGGRLAIENTTALVNATVIDHNNAVPALLFTVATVQLGALGGSADSALPTTSLTVGGNGASTTYSGALSGGGALIKSGSGTFTLAGTNNYTGGTTVSAGTLRLTGTLTGTTSFGIAAGATLELAAGTLAVSGTVTNQGTVRLTGSTSLSSSGTFTNAAGGVLDLINGPQTLPPNFVNQGTVLDSSSVRVQSITRSAGAVEISIQSHVGHQYQLQRRDSLGAGTWENIGGALAGTGGVLHFSDPARAGSEGFYRLTVTP